MGRLNAKQRKTLHAIFQQPTRSDVNWNDIIGLFKALGAYVDEARAGSRVAINLDGQVAYFHAPHPAKVTDKGAVNSVKRFLITVGVQPDA